MKKEFSIQLVGLLASFALLTSACAPSGTGALNASGDSSNIVNGEAVASTDPVAASTVDLYYYPTVGKTDVRNLCSGVVIGNDTILTAAHCFVDASKSLRLTVDELAARMRVGFGTNIVKKDDDTTVTLIPVAQASVHPLYVMGKLEQAEKGEALYDMAIIKLGAPIPTGAVPARLIEDTALLQQGTVLTLAGFGLTAGGFFGTPAKQLMKTSVTIENPALNPTQFRYQTTDKKTACSGDSGGPAYFVEADGSLSLAGVTSWGDGGCTKFGVYTSVPAMSAWIKETAGL